MAQLTLHNVSLDYPIVTARSQSLRLNMMRVGSAGRLARDARGQVTVTALDGISFSAQEGDRVALLGRNGAGKTTMLRVLAGIYPPTKGRIDVQGKISSLLGISLPVDEELSGYEAVRYACLMRGITSAATEDVLRDVTEFTELGEYLNLPVRTYSSGMKVRLAFAVATYEDPDILILDEGITAGDAFFLERSQKRAERFIGKANIIFLASHSEHLVRSVCNKGILLDQGRIVAAGGIDELFEIYATIDTRPGNRPVVSMAPPSVAVPEGSEETPELPPVELFSSEHADDHQVSDAFDGCEITYWKSADNKPVIAHAHLGVKFPTKVIVQTVLLRQRVVDLQAENNVRTVAIEVSDDAFDTDIRRTAVVDLSSAPVLHRIPIEESHEGRWWRVIALSTFKPGLTNWEISRFDLLSDALPAFHAGNAVSSGRAAPGVSAENAFYDGSDTPWVSETSAEEVEDAAWIGWDFGLAHRPTIHGFEIEQWNGGGQPNTVGAVTLECSEEPFSVHVGEVARFTLNHDTTRQTFWLKVPRKARFWRISAGTGTNGGRWGVNYLKFIEHPDPSDDETQLKD